VNPKRRKSRHFDRLEGVPNPLVGRVERRVHFNEVDVMGVAWHGRYAEYFEEGWAALGGRCGLAYADFAQAQLFAPVVQLHVDYFLPLKLSEEFTITTSLIWSEGARINSEYILTKPDGSVAAAGYTVQMFIDVRSDNVCLTPPDLWLGCRRRWKAGDYRDLQSGA